MASQLITREAVEAIANSADPIQAEIDWLKANTVSRGPQTPYEFLADCFTLFVLLPLSLVQ